MLMSNVVGAQPAPDAGDPRFYGGVRLAFSMSDVNAPQEYDPRFGLGGGVYVAGSVWKQFDLRVEANYTQKGARIAFGRTSFEWQLDYLEFPVMAVYNVMPRSETSVEFCAGVSYGISLQKQAEEGDNLGYDIDEFIDQNIPLDARNSLVVDSVEDTELCLALGMGLSVPVGAVNFMVDVRYAKGLTDPVVGATFERVVGDGANAHVEEALGDISSRVFSFFVGFEFPFGSRTASE